MFGNQEVDHIREDFVNKNAPVFSVLSFEIKKSRNPG